MKVTPQREAVWEVLAASKEHPSAEMVYRQVRERLPNISFDTVNRTLHTFSEAGLAAVVEGSGEARRYDADMQGHQHFRCVKCRRVIDFHHDGFDNMPVPAELAERFTILRTSVYVEGICDRCRGAAYSDA